MGKLGIGIFMLRCGRVAPLPKICDYVALVYVFLNTIHKPIFNALLLVTYSQPKTNRGEENSGFLVLRFARRRYYSTGGFSYSLSHMQGKPY